MENCNSAQAIQKSILLLILQLVLLAVAIYFVCFHKLGDTVINEYDESIAIQVIQEMRASGKWWHPHTPTQALYSKPPFKMWLTYIPLHFWGESAFSYRFVDGLAGAFAAVILFFVARALFCSPLAGLAASFALLGSKAYVEEHGIRMAVQDSMLTLLVLCALLFAYRFVTQALERDNRQAAKTAAQLCGLFTGLAVMTKSIVGFLPVVVFVAYLLLSRDYKKLIAEHRIALVWLFALCLIPPTLFYLPHFLFTEGAFARVVGREIVDRAVDGFHHQDSTFYYFNFIFVKNAFVPPMLLVASILFGLWQWIKNKSRLYLFLIVWAVLPVILFSIPPSRLYWYIVPALPAMALLVAGLLANAFTCFCEQLQRCRNPKSLLLTTFSAALICYGAFTLSVHYFTVLDKINGQLRRTGLDLFTEEFLQKQQDGVPVGPVLFMNRPKFSFAELAYQNMLSAGRPDITSKEEKLTKFLNDAEHGIIISDIPTAMSLFERKKISQYKFLRPERGGREQWLAIASLSTKIHFDSLLNTIKRITFGNTDISALYGLRGPMPKHWEHVHSIHGPATALLVEADSTYSTFGTWATIKAAKNESGKFADAKLSVELNGRAITTLNFEPAKYSEQKFFINPKHWISGKNTLTLHSELPNAEVASSDEIFYLKEIAISIAQPHQN